MSPYYTQLYGIASDRPPRSVPQFPFSEAFGSAAGAVGADGGRDMTCLGASSELGAGASPCPSPGNGARGEEPRWSWLGTLEA